MISAEYVGREMVGAFPFEATEAQRELMERLAAFVAEREERSIFVLHGYAGTGKTTVMAALVEALSHTKLKTVLLAPTGRAAKVISRYAGRPAYTIHKRLYRGDALDPYAGGFMLAPNKDRDTVFIVDEASMIPGVSGHLLRDLLTHVYSSPGCVVIFVGDTAQLPPVGEVESLAMSPGYLEGCGLRVTAFELEEPLRQAQKSGILYNATRLRRRMFKSPLPSARLWPWEFPDVQVTTTEYLAEQIADAYRKYGQDNAIIVTRANWRASAFNRAIRATVLYAEERLQKGERLVIAKNNYFWTQKIKDAPFIANGEGAVVQRIFGYESRYGHDWADVELRFPDTGLELEAKLLLTCLDNDAPNLPQTEYTELYEAVLQDIMADESVKPGDEMRALRKSPYLNALQAKYGYCLTCHKAQGGQWEEVYVDLASFRPEDLTNLELHRWLYTAITRAVSRLYLINPSLPLNADPEPGVNDK